jgi:hypothetical protein
MIPLGLASTLSGYHSPHAMFIFCFFLTSTSESMFPLSFCGSLLLKHINITSLQSLLRAHKMFGDTELGKWIAHAMLSEDFHRGARSLEVHDFVRAVECDQGAQS